jgi:hypothetical protein
MSTIDTHVTPAPAPDTTAAPTARHGTSLMQSEIGRTVELLEVLHAMALSSERRMLAYYISMALAEARSMRDS